MRYLKRVILAAVAATMILFAGASVDAAIVLSNSKDTIVFSGMFESGDSAQMIRELGNLDFEYVGQRGLHIWINSHGGSGPEMMTIMGIVDDFMKKNGCILTTHCNGIAASAGAILFLRGDRRIVHSTATIMIHKGAFYDEQGNKLPRTSPRIPAYAWKRLDRCNAHMVKYVKSRTKMTESMIDAEMFLSAEEALKYGVATKISD